METLILITGTYRLDNLLKIAKSINKYYDEYIDKFNIIWLICIDQNHVIGNIDNVINYLGTTNINYKISYININKDKIYGGDLFNDALSNYVSLNNTNPWIYILDDDNLLHPGLFNTFNTCLINNFYNYKEIIVLTCKFDEGHLREMYKESLGVPDRNNFIEGEHMVDPSGVIMKYNIILKYNGYPNIFLYDFNWLNPLLLKENDLNNIIFYVDYSFDYNAHYVNSYHNAIKNIDHIKSYNKHLKDMIIDVHIQDMDIQKHATYVPILSDNIKEKIYNLILEELKI